MNVTADLLTAAGLLLATIGLVFSAWHTEMMTAVATAKKSKRLDRDPQIATVRRTLWSRAVPLQAAVTVLAIALAPPAISVMADAMTVDWGQAYDPVRAIFVIVWLLTVAVTAAIGELTWRLYRKWRDLEGPDQP